MKKIPLKPVIQEKSVCIFVVASREQENDSNTDTTGQQSSSGSGETVETVKTTTKSKENPRPFDENGK
jgi:hypothetical protein